MIKSRRKMVRIVSFLTAIILALAVFGIVNMCKLKTLQRETNASRERALTALGTYMDDINLNLQKCMYVKSEEMLSDITSKLWRSSSSAKNSLSEITDGNTEISSVYKFLSQVGEYTLSLNEKISKGEKLSEEETQNLKKLKEYSDKISQNVNYLIEQEEAGALDFEEIKSTLQNNGEERLYLGNELNDTNEALEDFPTLIYDGPFSDNIESKKSDIVENLEEISKDEALKKASEFLGIDENQLYFLSKTNSNLSTYTFYNTDYTISVTQKGGLVSYLLAEEYSGEEKISSEDAIKKATEFLNRHGYTKIKETYYSTNDGICTVNFAFYDKGITYYTDLIKVNVAMDTGKITAFDATGYLMNHKNRVVPANTKYTLESGAKLLRDGLTLISSKKAYIPTEWETEYYVYEYHCKAEDGEEVLLYIDPVTGQEKDVLILLYADNGVLTK